MDRMKKMARESLAPMLHRSLADVVRGLRSRSVKTDAFVGECIEQAKAELKQNSLITKANAMNKLVYLQMLGYDVGWASFEALELMSNPKFPFKRMGYFAASYIFPGNCDASLMAVNTCRKDLRGALFRNSSMALTALAHLFSVNIERMPQYEASTIELTRQFADDGQLLLTSSKPLIRQKAAILLSLIVSWQMRDPMCSGNAIQDLINHLVDCLDDSDVSVRIGCISGLCQVAYLSRDVGRPLVLPAKTITKLFSILADAENQSAGAAPNWLLIKLVKMLSLVTDLVVEEDMINRLLKFLTRLIQNASAMSVLYECINSVIAILLSRHGVSPSAIDLCAQKLSVLIEDRDQNLRYLGLQALGRLYSGSDSSQSSDGDSGRPIKTLRPRRRELVLNCLDDQDDSIRRRALQLLPWMVSERSLADVVQRIMAMSNRRQRILSSERSLNLLITKSVISLCSAGDYRRVIDFNWYVDTLIDLSSRSSKIVGDSSASCALIADQLMSVVVRVPSVRDYAADQVSNSLLSSSSEHICSAAAFIVGVYGKDDAVFEKLRRAGLNSSKVAPEFVYAMFKQESLTPRLIGTLTEIAQNSGNAVDLRLQERCSELRALREITNEQYIDKVSRIYLRETTLSVVSGNAQSMVKIPEGLCLDTPMAEPADTVEHAEHTADDAPSKVTKRRKKTGKKILTASKDPKKSSENKIYKQTNQERPVILDIVKAPENSTKQQVECCTMEKESEKSDLKHNAQEHVKHVNRPVYEDSVYKVWLEAVEEGIKLFVHVQSQNKVKKAKVKARLPEGWMQPLSLSFQGSGRLSHEHVYLEFRIITVSFPAKIALIIDWKCSQGVTHPEKLEISFIVPVSSFLIPLRASDNVPALLSGYGQRHVEGLVEDPFPKIQRALPVFFHCGVRQDKDSGTVIVMVRTVNQRQVVLACKKPSGLIKHYRLKLSCNDSDYLVSLADELTRLIAP